MACNCIDRNTLKNYFKQCATPTEQNFSDLIDAFFHACEDDRICNNLTVEGGAGFNQDGETASLFLGDQHHSIQSTHGRGVTINSFGANDAFFLEQGTGKIGIGTTIPAKKLDVNGDANIQGELCAQSLDIQGNVNVQGTITATSLNIAGSGLVPVGAIIMWSGNNAPTGWAICDGTNGTPDLRGRFIVGKSNNDANNYGYPNSEKNVSAYSSTGNIGGLREVKLSGQESGVRGHGHTATTSVTINNGGAHSHNIKAYNGGSRGPDYPKWGNARDSHLLTEAIPNGGAHSHSATATTSVNPAADQPANVFHENRPPYYALAYIVKT